MKEVGIVQECREVKPLYNK